ncbi:E3 ubiquitin-protein ligase TRIM71-like isoform X2 [Mytilus trossulus]|uniref:E3 ubiquitin-protein ligase TRIM71-like isoform X2 n=1 Tax=Mytilus trossulus TaxID=6551 RepID=UPI003004EFB6
MMAQASAQKCYICTEKNSGFYCYECQHALCAVCRERHDKVPSLSGHTIADINVIDLSNVQSNKYRCKTHEKDFSYYCAKCSDLICGKCVTSSHKGHSFSDISEIVSEKRETAQTALHTLKSKIEVISSVEDIVRGKHVEKLHAYSQEVITDITSTFKELHTFIKSKEDIKKTEVEDNERIEQQNIELFLKNTCRIHDRYDKEFTALQNILCEKHDITFYKFYNAIDKDITFLDNIPKEPTLPCVRSLDKTMLYTEILEYIQSKTDTRVCKNCITQEERFVTTLEENKQLKRDVDDKVAALKAESNQVKHLQLSIEEIKSEYARKQAENKNLSKEIIFLKESITKTQINQEKVRPAPFVDNGVFGWKPWKTHPACSDQSNICRHCNSETTASDKFCGYCGSNV